MNDFITEKPLPAILNFVNTKPLTALKDGVLFTLPLTIIGSVFLLLANIPYQPAADFIVEHGWKDPLLQGYGATFAIIALVACIGIAYSYVKSAGYEPLSAGIIALVVFVLTTNSYIITEEGTRVDNVIPKALTSGEGMITAIIIGLAVGFVYVWFSKNDIRIKMPEGVPEGVANSFTALVPAAAIIFGATLVYIFFKYALDTTMIEFIYKVIQTPLQGVTNSFGGMLFMVFMIPFLWFFGVHGASIVDGIMTSILTSNSLANQAILDAGRELTIANGGYIVTQQFFHLFLNVTGTGITIGLVVYIWLFAKSAQLKSLGKLSIGPALFNINEPIIFGVPLVMNPFMAIPFICMPMISGTILYTASYLGIVPLFTGIMVPWTCPPIISGFLAGGWRMALLQGFVLLVSFFVYLPFIRKVDQMNVKNERAVAENNQGTSFGA